MDHPVRAKLGNKSWAEVQELLRSDDYSRQLRVRESRLHADLYILSYEQAGTDWKDAFTRECRGQAMLQCQATNVDVRKG